MTEMYEKFTDREQQNLGAFQLERHIRMLGVDQITLDETAEKKRLPYDYRMMHNSMWVSVVEVKARVVDSRTVKETWGSLLVEMHTLTALKKVCTYTSEVTGKTEWSKGCVFVMRCIKDDVCFAINVLDIIDNWDDCKPAPEWMMKDNHGTEPSGREGILVPIELWSEFK